MGKEQDRSNLDMMKDGDNITINWSEEGGGDVYCINGGQSYALFEVPQFGGHGIFVMCSEEYEKILNEAYSWS